MKYLTLITCIINLLFKLLRKSGTREIIAENILLKQQLQVLTRNNSKRQKFTIFDRYVFGVFCSKIAKKKLHRLLLILKPLTILKFHRAIINKKYSQLFSKKSKFKPGPKGPSKEVIEAIIALKKHNPRFGYLRIAMQVNIAFGLSINKDVVRRVLEKHNLNNYDPYGQSWLSFLANMKDSLWSVDLFRVESINLKSHWVMLVIDQYTRQIIGFAVNQGSVSGPDICCMFNTIIRTKQSPKFLSSDNDPLFNFHRWKANLSIYGIEELKTVPYTPISHPFVERLIGTVRREFLDHILFWNIRDLERKLDDFKHYYNGQRCHSALNGQTPAVNTSSKSQSRISIKNYAWKKYCNGVFQLPCAV